MKTRIRKLYKFLIGEWLDEMVKDVGSATADVGKRVDELLNRAQLDGEEGWLLRDKMKKNNMDKGGPVKGV